MLHKHDWWRGVSLDPPAFNREGSAFPGGEAAERRLVTVLFADLMGFTTIAERLGEEGTHSFIEPILDLMAEAVEEHGGTVKDFTGDGIMALFGVPAALEDGPLRACRAVLRMHERLARVASELEGRHGVRPHARVGINSGPIVVGQVRHGSGMRVSAVGDTVNLAARLQGLAEPGTAVMSETTYHLVQGLVDAAFAGTHAVKGKAEPQRIYRLDAVREGARRFEAALHRGLTAYVGREHELGVLAECIAHFSGGVQVVDIVGEPGAGKSRLLHEVCERVDSDGMAILAGGCTPDGRQTPLLPFVELIRGLVRATPGAAESDLDRGLELAMADLDLQSAQDLGLMRNLMGLAVKDDALTGLDEMLIGLRTRTVLHRLFEACGRRSPIVLLLEDLHWIDGVSEEVLTGAPQAST